jgi:alpha-L-fucosidase
MSRYALLLIIAFNIITFSLSGLTANASQVGGGNQNPNLETDAKAIAKWQEARIGLTVHWGPVALRGTEIGWSRSEQVAQPDYDSLYKEFNPVLFDSKEWVRLLKDSGVRYVTLVSKHHDGFVMWGTKQTDHNIMNSAFHRDWLKEISDECRKQGIMFGVYYSGLLSIRLRGGYGHRHAEPGRPGIQAGSQAGF